MKAIILAAGKATRLLPLTRDTPQSLLKIDGKTILDEQLITLNKCGINDILVVTGYLADEIGEYLSKKKDVKTFFNPVYSVSGMLMSLWITKEEMKGGFILLYSDVLFEKSIIDNLLSNKSDICLAIKKGDVREEAEKVSEENGLITKISKMELAEGNAEFIGMAKFTRNGARLFIDEMNEIVKDRLDASFIGAIMGLIGKGHKIYSSDIGNAKWVDIDFEKDLKLAESIFSK